MSQPGFELRILRQHWIDDDGIDNMSDLCSHGEVYARIGAEELSNKGSGSWTTSAAGLYLLRSLGQDCGFLEFLNPLLPCCGFNIYPNKSKENFVEIIGCPNGIDWKINHHGSNVVFESEQGNKAVLPFQEYREIVLCFIYEVEDFYGDPEDKFIADDGFDKDGFNQFWAEWRELRDKWQ